MPPTDTEDIYRLNPAEDIPWFNPELPLPVRQFIEQNKHVAGRLLELGCGLGHHAIAAAKLGYDVTAVDISPTAIERARELSVREGVACTFISGDVRAPLDAVTPGFTLGWDWEMLHHIAPGQRAGYVENLRRLLLPGASYLSVSFSMRDPLFGGIGAERVTPIGTVLYFSTAAEIRTLFERAFEVVELQEVVIPGRQGAHVANSAQLRA